MAGWTGFGRGLQAGVGMGMQMKNMQWQNEERKKIEQKSKDTETALSNFFGSSYGQTMIVGGSLSKDDQTMFLTALQGANAEAQSIMLSAHNAWQRGDKETYNREIERWDVFVEYYGDSKFNTGDVNAAFEGLIGTFTSQDAINAATAGKAMLASRREELDTTRLDIAVKGAGVGSEAAIAEVNALLGTNITPDTSEEMWKVYNNANVTLSNAAALGESAFNTVKDNMKINPKYKDTGINWDNITYEGYTTKPGTPKAPADLGETKSSLTSIEDAPDAKTARTFASAFEREHGEGSLANLGITEEPGQYWASKQTYILENLGRDLETLVNEYGFVKPSTHTERNLLGPKQTKTNAEWYQALYGEYKSLYDEMKATGMDMTGILQIVSISDIRKITSKTIKPGTAQGDWRSGGWWLDE